MQKTLKEYADILSTKVGSREDWKALTDGRAETIVREFLKTPFTAEKDVRPLSERQHACAAKAILWISGGMYVNGLHELCDFLDNWGDNDHPLSYQEFQVLQNLSMAADWWKVPYEASIRYVGYPIKVNGEEIFVPYD
jgi:hypothetical protein